MQWNVGSFDMANKRVLTPCDAITYQIIGYLAVTQCPVGLLINFGGRSLQWRRILPPKTVAEHQVNRQWLFVPEWLR